ncbi:MAG: hypothetical protein ACR2NO_10060 [Chloroflexota bacterium]
MSALAVEWTAGLRWASPVDPSGVQGASTGFQGVLLPGMSTQTNTVRYISLFVAARHHRMQAGREAEARLSWTEHLRRLEALIAVSSVRHHRRDGQVPTGVVGIGAGHSMASSQVVRLHTGLVQPPYSIYRGTLAGLGLSDLSQSTDPLFDSAKPLAVAWDPRQAGPLADAICAGVLPETVPLDVIDAACAAFCLCRVPDGTSEQEQLSHLLLGIDRQFAAPRFGGDEEDPLAMRAVTWRFVLELVALSPGEPLADTRLIARLMRPDLLDAPLKAPLRACLFAWRWVAARTLFERGWTVVFERALNVLRGEREGMDRAALVAALGDLYHRDSTDALADVAQTAQDSCQDSSWLLARLTSRRPADLLKAMCAGIYAALRDQERHQPQPPSLLEALWHRGPIPFDAVHRSLQDRLAAGSSAASLWAQWGEQALLQHITSSLQKMRSPDNPDSLLCDYEGGVWRIPAKVGNARPNLAGAGSRLDIALSWARQLGLVTADGSGGLILTPAGERYRARWDDEHA